MSTLNEWPSELKACPRVLVLAVLSGALSCGRNDLDRGSAIPEMAREAGPAPSTTGHVITGEPQDHSDAGDPSLGTDNIKPEAGTGLPVQEDDRSETDTTGTQPLPEVPGDAGHSDGASSRDAGSASVETYSGDGETSSMGEMSSGDGGTRLDDAGSSDAGAPCFERSVEECTEDPACDHFVASRVRYDLECYEPPTPVHCGPRSDFGGGGFARKEDPQGTCWTWTGSGGLLAEPGWVETTACTAAALTFPACTGTE